jgi:hypothetical protein
MAGGLNDQEIDKVVAAVCKVFARSFRSRRTQLEEKCTIRSILPNWPIETFKWSSLLRPMEMEALAK